MTLPDADLEHAAEQLGVVGDDPADVNDEFLLQHGLSLAVRTALPVDDVLNDGRRQRVRDHLLLVSKKTQSYLGQHHRFILRLFKLQMVKHFIHALMCLISPNSFSTKPIKCSGAKSSSQRPLSFFFFNLSP